MFGKLHRLQQRVPPCPVLSLCLHIYTTDALWYKKSHPPEGKGFSTLLHQGTGVCFLEAITVTPLPSYWYPLTDLQPTCLSAYLTYSRFTQNLTGKCIFHASTVISSLTVITVVLHLKVSVLFAMSHNHPSVI